jgi:hypothetical protein
MSREARVGRAMFDIKDLIVTRISNQVVDSLHRHNVNVTTEQRNLVLRDVQNELEVLFNNATDNVLRASRD